MPKYYTNIPVESDLAEVIRQNKKSDETYSEVLNRLMGQNDEV